MKDAIMINPPYRFLSDVEPTDEQLEELMKDVLQDVKDRAAIANEKFELLQREQIMIAVKKYKQDYEKIISNS